MKTLSSNALTEIAKQYGTEPINIVEIEWTPGSSTFYSDKKLDFADGKILDLANIQSTLSYTNLQINQTTVTLDDTDGVIKDLIDSVDIHKKKAVVYQYYGGLASSDKFTIFEGAISTPFSWGEGDRQITFNITTNVETFEVGFSPEEGQLDFVSDAAVGDPWPLAFGNVVHSPTVRVTQNQEARTLEMFGIIDPLLPYKLSRIEEAYQFESFLLNFWILVMFGADTVVSDKVGDVIDQYIVVINDERQLSLLFTEKLEELNGLREDLEEAGKDPFDTLKIAIEAAEAELVVISSQVQTNRLIKENIEQKIKLLRFEFDLRKKAANKQIETWDKMRALYFQYTEVQREYARQQKFVRSTIQCENIQDFPLNTDVDVVIKGVCWRVQFNSDGLMTIVSGPHLTQKTATVTTWAPDDDDNILGDYNLFRIFENPAPNLEGQYMLVTDVLGRKHVIQIERQDNQKLYFKLVEWDKSGTSENGKPRGLSIDELIRETVETPFVPNQFGNPIPASAYTGDNNPELWNTEESKVLLEILAFTGPLTKEELENATMLAYLYPADRLDSSVIITPPDPREVYTLIGVDIVTIDEIAGFIPDSWLHVAEFYEEIPESAAWQAPAGSTVRDKDRDCEIYICNILPSTIKSVYAYRTNEYNERVLQAVPTRYYSKKESNNLGTIDVTALVLPRKLSEIQGEGWEDEIYVSLESSIGPNVVDIIQHLIETYIDGATVNSSNFAAVKTKVDNYPADFTLMTRPDALEEIQAIAYESRLGIILQGSEFYLKYLSEEPTSDTTFSDTTNIEHQLQIEYTKTENLTTVIEATFNRNYLPLRQGEKQPRIILRSNVKKYGYHKKSRHYHIYNNIELVRKSATFWLIRDSNTWKHVTLKTVQSEMDVETLDTVLLQSSFVASSDVKCLVESVTYDLKSNEVIFKLHAPVRAGEMSQYDFFWPSSLDSNIEYPPVDEVEFAGAYGPGSGVTGTIDGCSSS